MRVSNLLWLLIAINFQLALAPDPLQRPSSSIFPSKPGTRYKRPKPMQDTDIIKRFKEFKVTDTNPAPATLVEPFLYQGGSYEIIQDTCSKFHTVESDHAPHSSLLLQYLDEKTLRKLPKGTQLQIMMEEKVKLDAELKASDFSANEQEINNLKKEIDELDVKLGNKITHKAGEIKKRFDIDVAITQNQINDKNREISILKKMKTGGTNGDEKLAELKKELGVLKNKMSQIHSNAKENIQKMSGLTAEEISRDSEKLKNLKSRREKLETDNKQLPKSLDKHMMSMKNVMAVFSLPYKIHRLFPSTGVGGLDKEIRGLKNANADTAAKVKEEYDGHFRKNMELAREKGMLKDTKRFSDPQELYRHNLNEILEGAKKFVDAKSKPKSGKDYMMDLLLKSYAKKFITSTIHALKDPGPGGSYAHLVKLFADEYKAYLGTKVFDGVAKAGLQKWLEANKNFGVLTDADLSKLKNDFKLNDADIPAINPTDQRFTVQREIEEKVAINKEKKPKATASSNDINLGAGAVCGGGSSSRRKRSAGESSCIFSCQKCLNSDTDTNKNVRNVNDEVLPKPKINLPHDLDTTKVDAANLNKLLSQNIPDSDVESVRIRKAIVDHALKNQDKLSGTPDEIAKARALLQMEYVHTQSLQTDLVKNLAHNSKAGGDAIPVKSLNNYDKVKIGMKTIGKKLGKFAAKAGKNFQGAYGKIMLAKGITSAIRQGDIESLAFIGGRIGLEYGLNAYSKYGKTIASSLGFAKSGAKLIGKVGGPVGDVLDIAWNGYMISKSISILNDPKATKFDRNDAIADIMGNTIDIAVTSYALVLSLAFPPLAPVFAAIAFAINLLTTIGIGFLNAQNNVDRLNEQLPLLDFERKQEYWRYVMGKDTSAYIQELIDIKRANNLVVNMTVHFLKNNTDYIGRVFPSKTFNQPGAPCHLEEKSEAKIFFAIPTDTKDWEKVSDCDGVGGYCKGDYAKYKCESKSRKQYLVVMGAMIYYEYRCRCGPEPDPLWLNEIENSEVDFRNKKDVYLERSAPDWALPNGFEYQCKPSTLNNKGPRVSRPTTSWEYLCNGAISVRRNPQTGKFMLYDLGNGTDSVYLDSNENIDNLFIVEDGHKNFNGNAGDDTFILNGFCNSLSGLLDGKGSKRKGGNTLVIGDDCKMDVDLTGKNKLKLNNIHRVVGRDQKADKIIVGCDTTQVSGGGGYSANQPDIITLPSCGASYEAVIAVEGYTEIDASKFSKGSAFILLNNTSLQLITVVPKLVLGTLLFKFNDSVGQLTSHSISSTSISLQFGGRASAKFKFLGKPTTVSSTDQCDTLNNKKDGSISIVIANSLLTCQLTCNLEMESIQANYQLRMDMSTSPVSVHGYDFMENVWHLESGQWQVLGGRVGSHFILKSTKFSGHLNGSLVTNSSAQNRLTLMNDLGVVGMHVDFGKGFLKEVIGSYQITFSKIHSLVGRQNYVENVTTSCTTKSVDLGGTVRDYVFVPEMDCDNELLISVRGKVDVVDWKKNGTIIVQAGYDTCSKVPLEFSISTKSDVARSSLFLNYPVYKLKSIGDGKLEIDDGKVEFDLKQVYLEEGESSKSVLVYEGEQKKWVSFHELLNSSIARIRKGADIIDNVFKLEGGEWDVKGGEMDDSFSLVDGAFHGRLDGLGGTNTLFIGNITNETVKITGDEILAGLGPKRLLYKNINQVIGRSMAQELIEVNCDIHHIALGGGELNKPDRVIIRNNECWIKLTIVGVGNTEVVSEAANGTVDIYLISDDAKNLKFKGNVSLPTSNVFFTIPIQVPAYQLTSYTMTKEEELDKIVINLRLKLLEHNFVEFKWTQNASNYEKRLENFQMLFVDDESRSNGNILMDEDSVEISVLHVLQVDSNGTEKRERKGAIGAKNIFRLHNGTWDAYGGKFDDSFIINSNNFNGMVHGMGGINSLVLTEFLNETEKIEVDLPNKTVTFDGSKAISAKSIQIVGGRKKMRDKVICACDTKLVMLEGGSGQAENDEILVRTEFCQPEMTFVLEKFTNINNNASKGNFTYHVRTANNFEINYYPELETNHAFKFEMNLEEIANVSLQNENSSMLLIQFVNQTEPTHFPLNSHNQPTFHFGPGPELVAELTFGESAIPTAAIIARYPYSGKVVGFSGAENEIIISTVQDMVGVWSGMKMTYFTWIMLHPS